ncbi:MAG: M48 family metallopeptidase [Gammaproteobacteria bacterium]|nr:M48 family metallopeptidase [Gammaproteobacteria bacterium]
MHKKLHSNKMRLALCLLLFLVSVSHAELPELGDPTKKELSPFEEYLMGKQFYQTLRSNIPFVEDLVVNDYLTTLGQKLVSQTGESNKQFHFFILKIPSINAFAGPDAYIGIHTGLILSAQNESELAGVLAHEISHVTQRHLARAMTESSTSPGVGFAAILAGILVSAQNPAAGAAIIYGSAAGMMQSQINFTRQNEYEADRIAISVLRNANISPDGMTNFFETLLAKSESSNELAQIEYLRTHPLSSTRIAESKHRIQENDHSLPKDSLNFQLTKARIMVVTAPSVTDLIARFKSIDKEQMSISDQYAMAIALMAHDNHQQAVVLLKKLIQRNDHPWFKLALAKAYEHNHQDQLALDTLDTLNQTLPNYLPVVIEYALLLNSQGNYDRSLLLLKRILQYQKHPVIYETLAQTYYSKGQIGAALEATSYQYEQEGHLKLAAQQIDNALKQPDLDTAAYQRLESRKGTLLEQLKREKIN